MVKSVMNKRPECTQTLSKVSKKPIVMGLFCNGADEGTIIDTFSIKEYKQIINKIGLLMSNN